MSLDLSDCELVSDLEPLKTLTRLSSLNLCNCKSVSDLGRLRTLTGLTTLRPDPVQVSVGPGAAGEFDRVDLP